MLKSFIWDSKNPRRIALILNFLSDLRDPAAV